MPAAAAPVIVRAARSQAKSGAIAVSQLPKAKTSIQEINVLRRPNRSATLPITGAPSM